MAEKPIFDSTKQFFAFLHKAREEQREEAEAVGIFGSRTKGDHRPDESDVDMMVIKKGVSEYGEYDFGNEEKINIVRIPPEIKGDSSNSQALKNMQNTTRFVWKKII